MSAVFAEFTLLSINRYVGGGAFGNFLRRLWIVSQLVVMVEGGRSRREMGGTHVNRRKVRARVGG